MHECATKQSEVELDVSPPLANTKVVSVQPHGGELEMLLCKECIEALLQLRGSRMQYSIAISFFTWVYL
jgi:hypothetical protein